MRSLFIIGIVIFSSQIIAGANCKVAEQAMIGAWVFDSGDGFFEEMAFSMENQDRIFNSWLHHRPEIFGATWTLQGCRLTITPASANEFSPFHFKVISLNKNKLRLQGDDKKIAQYKRIAE